MGDVAVIERNERRPEGGDRPKLVGANQASTALHYYLHLSMLSAALSVVWVA